eukprot:Lankesteria_metandrocarpae@DN1193_c0_g1_i1.p1
MGQDKRTRLRFWRLQRRGVLPVDAVARPTTRLSTQSYGQSLGMPSPSLLHAEYSRRASSTTHQAEVLPPGGYGGVSTATLDLDTSHSLEQLHGGSLASVCASAVRDRGPIHNCSLSKLPCAVNGRLTASRKTFGSRSVIFKSEIAQPSTTSKVLPSAIGKRRSKEMSSKRARRKDVVVRRMERRLAEAEDDSLFYEQSTIARHDDYIQQGDSQCTIEMQSMERTPSVLTDVAAAHNSTVHQEDQLLGRALSRDSSVASSITSPECAASPPLYTKEPQSPKQPPTTASPNANQDEGFRNSSGVNNIYPKNSKAFCLTPPGGMEMHILFKRWEVKALASNLPVTKENWKEIQITFLPHNPSKPSTE